MAELLDLWRKLESRSKILLQTLKDASGEITNRIVFRISK